MHKLILTALVAGAALAGCTASAAFSNAPPATDHAAVFAIQPREYNTMDSMARGPDGKIVVAVPNYNNLTLEKTGRAAAASPARLALLDPVSRRLTDWYRFAPGDLSPETGKVAPMGVAFGPDGNLYYVDRQSPYKKGPYSRIARIVIEHGKPMRQEVVVEGGFGTNDLAWRGRRLYVTDAAMEIVPKTANNISGVFAFDLDEFANGPVHLRPYGDGIPDPHLLTTFVSNNKTGAGADGIAFDDAGDLYVGINEEGTIFKVAMGADGRPAGAPQLFARDASMLSADGMAFDARRRRIYVADFLGNAIHAIDMQGKVTTLQRNDDSGSATGKLDEPCAVLILGDILLVANMDYVSAAPGSAVNSRLDDDHAISAIALPPVRQ
ncbi:hypothetical protein L2Y94_10760 [Luteibacter aegosomatis]|uniref:hypothetical protein n=1 Tax=Luteibacter aegosomatis TaxID=2911537 RepID=UPI001FF97F96|nr:hypothetical protein [Luteibacter aegosomatis]UPG83840.1 hypothetical protein L2Y94_10760 [Luteibacter aegosomatis]